ncbi:MAG: DnaD domain protein [Dehalococcoidia bacterium]|nr:MAG: DnaD domain protein [Dehalococcoidia bacterium]
MKQINGFPARMQFTSVPNFFFSTLLPQICDMGELKTTLHVLASLYQKKGYPRFVTYEELLASKSLMRSLKDEGGSAEKALKSALEMATKRGTFLHLALTQPGTTEDIYLLNTATDREAVAKIKSGELALPGLKARGQAYTELEEPPDIFTLYEQNIGMLTPMIAEELREAEKDYPLDWVRDAIREAVALNKRSWRYIATILERWSAEGKSNGTYRGHPAPKKGPDKYIKGKYGHMVRR